MVIAPLLLVLALAGPVEERGSTLSHGLIGSYIVASAMDLGSTMWCRGAQTCHEANRVLRPFENNPLAFAGVKTTVAVVTAVILIKQHKKHPKAVRVMAAGLTVASVTIAVRNTRTARR